MSQQARAGRLSLGTIAFVAVILGLVITGQARAASIPVATAPELVCAVNGGAACVVPKAVDGDVIELAANTAYNPNATLLVGANITIRGSASAPGSSILGSSVPSANDVLSVQSGKTFNLEYVFVRTAGATGGSVALRVAGTANVSNSAFTQNAGNAISVSGTANFVNTTVAGNTGIGLVVGSSGTANLTNTTVAGNTGAGINNAAGSTVNLTNTIVALNGNATGTGTNNCTAAVTSSVTSLSPAGLCSVNIVADPRLGSLTSAGSSTPYRPLQASPVRSPAIDAGTSVGCPTIDQRGKAREDGQCDIGSFELDETAPSFSGVPADITVEETAPGAGAVVTYTDPTANDTNDGPRPVTCTPSSGATFSVGSTTVTCSASDASGNTGTATFVVTVTPPDVTGPTITTPGNLSFEGDTLGGKNVAYSVTAADPSGIASLVCSPASGSLFPVGTTTVNCTAVDQSANPNSSSASFDVTVTDTVGPVLSLPADITAEGDTLGGKNVSFSASANDVVAGPASVTCAPVSGSLFPVGATTVSCSATDGTNASNGSFTVTITDTVGPVLSLPADITAEGDTLGGKNVSFSASANDVVAGPASVTCAPVSGSLFPVGATTVSCSATDGTNASNGSFTVTITDTVGPVLSLPADITAEGDTLGGKNVSFSASANDVVAGPASVTCAPVSGSLFPVGATTVSCSATDGTNASNGSFTVTITDTVGPVLSLPADITAEGDTLGGKNVGFTASATDVVAGAPAVTCSPAPGSLFPVGATTVSCSATDGTNASNGSFTVTITDTVGPVLSLPADITAEGDTLGGKNVGFTASATDVVAGAPAVTCSPAPGSLFPVGATTVSCSATDGTNASNGSFTVTVTDTVGPVLSLPANISVEGNANGGANVVFALSASDVVGPASPVVNCTYSSGALFPLGTTTVLCSATDTAGNPSSGSFTVTVVDTTAPVLVDVPTNITVPATDAAGAVVTYTDPTATDIVDPTPTVSCVLPSGSVFPVGTTTVTCTATDAAGNSSSGSFTVTVVGADEVAPVLSVTGTLTVEATGSSGAVVSFTVTAVDNLDGSVSATCDATSGLFPIGSTVVNCSATDSVGNVGTLTFTITVQDTTGPVITAPNVTVSATSPSGATVSYLGGVSATDVVDGAVTVSCLPGSGTTFPIGLTTVTCTANDSRGNATTKTFLVKVLNVTEQLQNLQSEVSALQVLSKQVTNAMLRDLRSAERFFTNGNLRNACSRMDSFIARVTANTPPIGAVVGTGLINDANRIKAVMGC